MPASCHASRVTRHVSWLSLALLACAALFSSGCLKIMYYIQLEDDARGVLTEVVKIEQKVLMLEKDLKEAVGLKELLVEDQARERAKLMGTKLVAFKVERTRDGGLQSTASYTFDHIRDLRLPLYPWPTPTTNTYWQKALIAFQYADDEVQGIRQLWAYTIPPSPEEPGGKSEIRNPKSEIGRRSTPAELQKLRRLMPIFRDMLDGFQLFIRFQIGKKTDWLQSCPPHLPVRYLFRAWDGQYTLLALTDQHLTFDEDALMIVVPWEIAGNEDALLKKLTDARYVMGGDRDLRPDRPWEIERLAWRYTRLDGLRRLYAWALPDTGVSRLLPMDVPAVPPPPAKPRPDRYHGQYLGLDWRLLRLGDAKDIPKDFMKPAFDDAKWEKINIYVGEAAYDEKFTLYRKRFSVPPAWKGKRVGLRFGGVRDRCVVYLNGAEIARNDGWSRRFGVDVADKVAYGAENLLAVQCENLTDKGGIWGEVDIGDIRFTSEFHLTRDETLAEETPAQNALRAELPSLPGVIAFQVHKPGEPEMKENWDIYTMKPDGSGLKAIVAHPAADVFPKISPDGKTVLFLSLRDTWDEVLKMRKVPRNVWEELGVFYTVDIEGQTPPKRLWPAKGLGSDACWAPDGTAIAFAQHSPPRINILPLGSTGLGGTGVPPVAPLISHTPPEATEPSMPCFAPDGKRLFFISLEETEIEDRWGAARVAHLDPKTWQLVDKQWDRYLWGPTRGLAISPDGRQTAANTSHPHGGIRWEQFRWSWLRDSITPGRRSEDHLSKTDLGFAEHLMLPHWRSEMPERRMYNECPAWAPNSRYILFVRGPDYHEAAYHQFVRQFMLVDWMDLYLSDPGGRRTVRLTWLRSRMGYPDWWAPR
ncbi:MAG: hypothetical protein FJ291_07300 [Planctomycetes bacterium]|nr:hypothetical protein [Planctomycetota bacterium]